MLKAHEKRQVRDWIEQLVGQGCLVKGGEYGVLQITADGRDVMSGDFTPRLLKASERGGRSERSRTRKESKSEKESWEGVDRGLFEALRQWRREKAEARGLPPFIIFGDAVLRDLARYRPSTAEALMQVRGIGQKKHDEYGEELTTVVVDHCRENGLATDMEA